jgi:hypothetical protein
MPLLPAAVQLGILRCSLTACETNSPTGPTCLVRISAKKFGLPPFTSDISIWCDAGAASWGATMENQNLQAQGFFPPKLWHGTSSSTLREMWGLLHSLESFLDISRHKSFQIFTDTPTWSELWARAVQTCA